MLKCVHFNERKGVNSPTCISEQAQKPMSLIILSSRGEAGGMR